MKNYNAVQINTEILEGDMKQPTITNCEHSIFTSKKA